MRADFRSTFIGQAARRLDFASVAIAGLSVFAVLATMFHRLVPGKTDVPIGLTAVMLLVAAACFWGARVLAAKRDGRSSASGKPDSRFRRNVIVFALPPLVVVVATSCAFVVASVIGALDPTSITAGFFGPGNTRTFVRTLWPIVLFDLLTGVLIGAAMLIGVREQLVRGPLRRRYLAPLAFISWGLSAVFGYQTVITIMADVQDLDRAWVNALMPVQWLLCVLAAVAAAVIVRGDRQTAQ